jgi:hypothetical protein
MAMRTVSNFDRRSLIKEILNAFDTNYAGVVDIDDIPTDLIMAIPIETFVDHNGVWRAVRDAHVEMQRRDSLKAKTEIDAMRARLTEFLTSAFGKAFVSHYTFYPTEELETRPGGLSYRRFKVQYALKFRLDSQPAAMAQHEIHGTLTYAMTPISALGEVNYVADGVSVLRVTGHTSRVAGEVREIRDFFSRLHATLGIPQKVLVLPQVYEPDIQNIGMDE